MMRYLSLIKKYTAFAPCGMSLLCFVFQTLSKSVDHNNCYVSSLPKTLLVSSAVVPMTIATECLSPWQLVKHIYPLHPREASLLMLSLKNIIN